jgi:hypothetical protein
MRGPQPRTKGGTFLPNPFRTPRTGPGEQGRDTGKITNKEKLSRLSRAGWGSGVSSKRFHKERIAIEGAGTDLTYRTSGFAASGFTRRAAHPITHRNPEKTVLHNRFTAHLSFTQFRTSIAGLHLDPFCTLLLPLSSTPEIPSKTETSEANSPEGGGKLVEISCRSAGGGHY